MLKRTLWKELILLFVGGSTLGYLLGFWGIPLSLALGWYSQRIFDYLRWQ